LRSAGPVADEVSGGLSIAFRQSGAMNVLSSAPLSTPGERGRMHMGFPPQEGRSSGGYLSAFYTVDGQRILASGPRNLPVVFLINDWSELPPVAPALQAAGKAAIVVDGSASDAAVVTTRRIRLSDAIEAQMRLGELVYEDGSTGLQADVTIPQGSGEESKALQTALALVRDFKPAPGGRAPLPARAVPQADKPYPDMTYPPLEYRLLAAFRIWTTVDYFFAYKDLMGEDWDGVLREFIPRMEKAANALEYHLAVAEMVTRMHDSHAFVISDELKEYFGVASPLVRARLIEGLPVVTHLPDDPITKAAGIEVGDLILRVDGEEVKTRMERYGKFIAASTPQAHSRDVMAKFLNGPKGSVATLVVQNSQGRIREARLARSVAEKSRASIRDIKYERGGEILRLLPVNIGYADLDRLTLSTVDEMFERFKDTKAIVFDMRGYPSGTAWAIAPRLSEKSSVGAASFQRPTLMALDGRPSTSYSFVQHLSATDKWRYRGKTVMLIDERTQSQAEHTGLFLEAANGTKFIGSHTAGANGDVTNFRVPGGILIYFSGQAVRHADGRQLQRIGLVPHIEVRPTIKGIQAGRDEVLEKAKEYLEQELKAEPQRL